MQKFPELRKNMEFVGSAQEQARRYTEQERKKRFEDFVKQGISADKAEIWAKKRVKTLKVDANTYAQSISDKPAAGISINEKFGKNPAALLKQLQKEVEAKFHPDGCDTIRSIADHEFGHQLDKLLDLRYDSSVNKIRKSIGVMRLDVSSYASEDVGEFVAECWAEYLNNPAPRPIAKSIGNLIRSRYRAKFG
jgi:hypothetical protein